MLEHIYSRSSSVSGERPESTGATHVLYLTSRNFSQNLCVPLSNNVLKSPAFKTPR